MNKLNYGYWSTLIVGLMMLFNSCEEQEVEVYRNNLIVKSNEINAFVFTDKQVNADNYLVIPWKIYVKGGAPGHQSGDYHFRVAEGTTLPLGLKVDPLQGVIKGSGTSMDTLLKFQDFFIEVTDGIDTVVQKFTLKTQISKNRIHRFSSVMQFNSPETNLVVGKESVNYGVSLTMQGGSPPYNYELTEGTELPEGLSLCGSNGVISGSVLNIAPGTYSFKVQCMDNKGNLAISMCTSMDYEEYKIVVR